MDCIKQTFTSSQTTFYISIVCSLTNSTHMLWVPCISCFRCWKISWWDGSEAVSHKPIIVAHLNALSYISLNFKSILRPIHHLSLVQLWIDFCLYDSEEMHFVCKLNSPVASSVISSVWFRYIHAWIHKYNDCRIT